MIVDLTLTDDQRMIADGIGGLIAGRLPIERLREGSAGGAAAERAAWDELAASGLFGLGVAEADGGVGYTAAEEALVALAMGRVLASPILLAQMLGAHLAGNDLRADIVSGAARVAFAIVLEDGACQVVDGAEASHVLLVGGGAVLLSIDALTARTAVAAIDDAIALERARVAADVPADGAATGRIDLLLAAYLAGMAAAARDMAVAYAMTREQFGQPIGAFQAIKHQCADLAVRAAAAESQCFYAAATFGLSSDSARDVAAARLIAREAALDNARANIQIHGGMGYTAECDAHLLLKRAHVVGAIGFDRAAAERRLLGIG